jgi:hypothetical protein
MSTSDPIEIQARQDREQLDLLAIFHYVAAGITALLSLLPLVQLALGLGFLARVPRAPRGEEIFAAMFGWFFVLVAGVAVACGLALAACLAVAGRSLSQRRRHTFCVAVAAVACVMVPFGTLLGIFSLLVLTRPSVRALFAASDAASPAAEA